MTPSWKRMARLCLKPLYGFAFLFLGAATFSYLWCAREADSFFDDSYQAQVRLQRGVESWLGRSLGQEDYKTGSKKFDGEWLFGTYLMAGLGFGQMALLHPELKEGNVFMMERCVERILSEEVKAFDKEAWGDDPIDGLENDKSAHAAYLGYFNMLLSMERLLNPASPHARLNDRVAEALARRLERSPTLLIETYPGERYPVDNCAAIGSLALYDKAAGADHSALIRRWLDNCKGKYVDKATGLLLQSVNEDGSPLDEPRGSGSALGLYFLSYADAGFARELYSAIKRSLAARPLNFGAVREYPKGGSGREDIDSGPIAFGYGFSATGFSIAGARISGDRPFFRRLYASAYLAGAPYDRNGERVFVTGGPLGTAILFAVLTAPKGAGQ